VTVYPEASDAERAALAEVLRRLGASEAELAATPDHRRGALALDLTLRDGRPPLRIADAAAALGVTDAELLRIWHALGLTSDAAAVGVPAALVDALEVVTAGVNELLGDDAALGVLRVVGTATGRLAESVVDAFRVGFEVPQLASGTSYSEVVDTYTGITRAVLPPFEALVLATLRAHLVRVAAGAWAPDADGAGARRWLAVGFADLVGYTALARASTPPALARMLRQFDDAVAAVLAEHDARLVKQIGDGVMFTAQTPAAAAHAGLSLTARLADSDVVPPVRVGIAAGEVLTHYGDYYGDVVNLAARLVALAAPSTVVVSDTVAGMLDAWVLERLPDQALKGFGAPSAVFRLRAPVPGRPEH
jgi:class 3 adenylate cyclase